MAGPVTCFPTNERWQTTCSSTVQAADTDSAVTVTFIMQGVATTALGPTIPFIRAQSLTFTVLGKSDEINVYPVAGGLVGNTINLHFKLPAGALPAPPSPDHLIDKNTRLYPQSEVFINQVFDGFTGGCGRIFQAWATSRKVSNWRSVTVTAPT